MADMRDKIEGLIALMKQEGVLSLKVDGIEIELDQSALVPKYVEDPPPLFKTQEEIDEEKRKEDDVLYYSA